jgi:uncharacterized protein (TIGR04551 family)
MLNIVREVGAVMLAAFLALALTAADVRAASEVTEQDGVADSGAAGRTHSAAATPLSSPVWVDHHASFRLRSDVLLGGDLGNTSSVVPVPLTVDGQPSNTLAWTSIRLRYDAAIHVGEPWTIHLGLDALDNLVMGSTFAGAGRSFEEGLWEDSQVSPVAGVSSFSDALEVRHLYGAWRLLEFIDVSAGRMPEHRGLGMWRQAGLCPDCNYGTYIDGAQLGVDIFGFRIDVGWEASAIGATSEMPGMPGQPTNFELSDDVNTWTLSLGHSELPIGLAPTGPVDDNELGWSFDWSVHAAISSQSLDTSEQELTDLGSDCAALAQGANDLVALPYECWRVMPRGASLYRPGGWFQAVWKRSTLSSLRLELELSALIGEIENTQNDPAYEDSAKSLAGIGGAFELEYRVNRLQTGLDVGFATGDDGDYLGVSDGQNISVEDELYLDDSSQVVRENETVSSFWFHRDYHIDLLLFRQVIGTVTNAVYVRPWIAYTLLETESVEMGARFDALYAAAMNPEGTPGKGDHWGVEFDASAWIDLPHGFGMSLHTGVLIPLDALNDRITGASPSAAFAARGLFYWRY